MSQPLEPVIANPRRSSIGRLAVTGLVAVSAAGLLAELAAAMWPERFPPALFEMFSLGFEGNLPTWYSSLLLAGCAAASLAVAGQSPPHRRRWIGLGACFVYISFDEVAEVHEHLGGHFGGEGLLYFDWVIPASVAVAALAFVFLPLVASMPPWLRRRVVAAGALYVGGALVMELPLGYVAESRGVDNLAYGLIDWVEETLELCGATLFALSAARYRARLAARDGTLSDGASGPRDSRAATT